ncbi:MAG: signal transduction histidine kinase [Myxococcota bacterium]|jgi:signal transduction histidine kinase
MMKQAPTPENEVERLAALRSYEILDSLPEQPFDDLTALAAYIAGVPIALVSLVDQDRQWFKSHHGLGAQETPRDISFCGHAIMAEETFVVGDATADERFADNPLTTDAPNVVFYAGTPLVDTSGFRLGTLCVIDHKPRELSITQLGHLRRLARQVISQMELRLSILQKSSEIRIQHRRERLKDSFFSAVNHELRTPLTAMRGSLRLLGSGMAGELTPTGLELVKLADRGCDRLIGMVTELLDSTQVSSGQFTLNRVNVGLRDVVEGAVAEVQNIGEARDITLKMVSGADNPTVNGDPSRIVQVIHNLLSNAEKFSPVGGTVTVGLAAAPPRFWVTDHGSGIPEEFHEDVFRPFAQADGNSAPGTGLGLSIVQAIVERHGGTIEFETEVDAGTTFTVTMPQSV